MPSSIPTLTQARDFLSLIRTHGLVCGLGKPVPGQMCVEAAWCYVLKLPHSDDPGCVGAEVRKLKINLNDKPWSSPSARANGLEAFGLAQLGSDQIDQKAFRDRFWFLCGVELQPKIWRFLATKGNKEARLELATKMELSKNLAECKAHAHAHAHAHAYAYDYGYAYGYAYDYGYAYGYAYDYDYDYDYGYDYDYDYDYGYDVWFSFVADIAVRVLTELGSPGVQYLYLLKEPRSGSEASPFPAASAP